MSKRQVAHELVRETFHYEPLTGVVTWRKEPRNRRVKVGDVAGTQKADGRWAIHWNREMYWSHILIWFWVHGVWPEQDIDHIDGDSGNNRLVNLRLASDALNQWNVVAPNKSNSTGYRGISPHAGKWQARITVHGKSHHLGTFNTPEEASAAYWAAKAEHHGEESYSRRVS